jgi:hypothetical protein
MFSVLSIAMLFSGSRDSWISFALGVSAGFTLILVSKRFRRKENR